MFSLNYVSYQMSHLPSVEGGRVETSYRGTGRICGLILFAFKLQMSLFLIKARAKEEHCISLMLSDSLEGRAERRMGWGGVSLHPATEQSSKDYAPGQEEGDTASCPLLCDPPIQCEHKVPFPLRQCDGKVDGDCLCGPMGQQIQSRLKTFYKELQN